jgi:type IX secretion system PorP/SprF family membrane protein
MQHFNKISKVFLACLTTLGFFNQQEIKAQYIPHYSQYMMQPSIINPAALGAYEGINGALLYRNQWTGLDGAPSTTVFDFNVPLVSKNSAFGLNFVDDRIGVTSNSNVNLSYAYRFQLNQKHFLSLGLSSSIGLMRSRFSRVTTTEALDPMFQADSPNLYVPNFKFGAYYFTKDYFVGFAMPNLLNNTMKVGSNNILTANTNFEYEAMHFFIHGGYQKTFGDVKLMPSVFVKQVAGAPMQIDINAQAMFNDEIGVGVSYRTSSTIVAMANFRFADFFRFGYAFNGHFGTQKQVAPTSHEAILTYELRDKRTARKRVPFDSPRF